MPHKFKRQPTEAFLLLPILDFLNLLAIWRVALCCLRMFFLAVAQRKLAVLSL